VGILDDAIMTLLLKGMEAAEYVPAGNSLGRLLILVTRRRQYEQ